LDKRVTALSTNTNILTVKSDVSLDESLNSEKLIKIEAKFTDLNFYDSVSGTVKPIDIRTLREIENVYFVPKSFSETNTHIVFRYPTKATVYVNKKDGLLYALNNGCDERKQAWHLLRILGKFGYVENFKRIQHRKQQGNSKLINGWVK
jgi:hypothetical protein